jgi:Leucine-rich repeat (LRR) protein
MQADAAIDIRHASTSLTSQRTESLDISSSDFPNATEDALQSLGSSISLPVELCFDLGDNNVSEGGVGSLQPSHFQTPGPAPETSPGLISSASNSEFEMGLAALASEFMLESEQEIVFLLRHYADNLAPWYVSTLY